MSTITLHHAKAGLRRQGRHTLRLEGGVVVGVVVVNTRDRPATLEQPCTGRGADKSGRARDDDRHEGEAS